MLFKTEASNIYLGKTVDRRKNVGVFAEDLATLMTLKESRIYYEFEEADAYHVNK